MRVVDERFDHFFRTHVRVLRASEAAHDRGRVEMRQDREHKLDVLGARVRVRECLCDGRPRRPRKGTCARDAEVRSERERAQRRVLGHSHVIEIRAVGGAGGVGGAHELGLGGVPCAVAGDGVCVRECVHEGRERAGVREWRRHGDERGCDACGARGLMRRGRALEDGGSGAEVCGARAFGAQRRECGGVHAEDVCDECGICGRVWASGECEEGGIAVGRECIEDGAECVCGGDECVRRGARCGRRSRREVVHDAAHKCAYSRIAEERGGCAGGPAAGECGECALMTHSGGPRVQGMSAECVHKVHFRYLVRRRPSSVCPLPITESAAMDNAPLTCAPGTPPADGSAVLPGAPGAPPARPGAGTTEDPLDESEFLPDKKKKKKGKHADSDAALALSAQVQTDLLSTASDLYRRVEADPHGFLYDEAYWESLPTHLRTFIRNALPLGSAPADGPAPRHTSTQTMIAVAQQLAQAAHASQRLHGAPQAPFDAGLLADLPLPLDARRRVPRPSPGMQAAAIPASTDGRHGPVVLVDELDDDGDFDADFDDEYVDDDLDLEPLAAPPEALTDPDTPKKKKHRKKKKDTRAPPPLAKRAPSVPPHPPPSTRAAGKLPMHFAARPPPAPAPAPAPAMCGG